LAGPPGEKVRSLGKESKAKHNARAGAHAEPQHGAAMEKEFPSAETCVV
jgi:hypothetical protein